MWLVWSFLVVVALVALAAWARTRRLAARLEALSQSYWELRYDYTRLRSQVARLDPDRPPEPAETPPPDPQVAFVPLSSLKPGPKS
jgi:hypothetical protein